MSDQQSPKPERPDPAPSEATTWPESRRKLRHDAGTALNQIIGYSEMLREQVAAEPQASLDADLAVIGDAGRRLQAILDQLLTLGERAAPEPGARAAARATTPSDDSHAPTAACDARAGRLLVVDDSELNRDLLARRLRLKGHQVETAEDGPSTLALVEKGGFDLILLDVNMPGMDGIEVLRHLRQRHSASELPVIMATARDGSEDIVAALEAGANDYVTKPLDMPVVLARTSCQLAFKRARDQVQELNGTLLAAQARIAQLVESSSEAMLDLGAWTQAMAADLSDTLGLSDLAVWVREGEGLTQLAGAPREPPPPELRERLARRGRLVEWQGSLAIGLSGLTGETFGVLLASGVRAGRDDTSERLLQNFARHLGGAVELQRTRRELSQLERQRQRRREELIEQGLDLLHQCPECGACFGHDVAECPDDGAALEAGEPFPLRVAGRYRLRRVLGQGGMGVVFEALDERLQRPVAVKIVKTEQFDDDNLRLRFENEARAVARIDHPGVIAVFDSGDVEDGSLYIVMELLEGHELGALIERYGPGRAGQVAALLRQGGAALAAAHRVGVVHRDVKPANIILLPRGASFTVKVLDFGVAKQVALETSLTQTGTIVGTPRYMSPEQISGRPVDARSDLYSFAAVAYLALCGRDVTRGHEFSDVLVDVLQWEPPPPSALRTGLPVQVDAAFAWALAKKPDDRPFDIAAWAETLAEILDGVPEEVGGWIVTDAELPPALPVAPAAPSRAEVSTKIVRNV